MALRSYLRATVGMILLVIAISGCAARTSVPEIVATPTFQHTAAPTNPAPTQEPQPTVTINSEPTATSTAMPEPTATFTATPEPTATDMPTPESTWIADGVIRMEEYKYQEDFSGLRFWWTNDATYLYFAVEGDTTGWVAVGFDPERRMQGANFLFGYITEGEVNLWDAFGTAPTGPNHPPDEDLGGTVDIVSFAGVEENGVTRFEVQIPLDSGDAFDKVLQPGQTYPFIIAMGGEDNFNAYHLKYAGGQLVLD